MAKYSYEFKLKVVQAYLNGEGSYDYLSKKNNIPAITATTMPKARNLKLIYSKNIPERVVRFLLLQQSGSFMSPKSLMTYGPSCPSPSFIRCINLSL